ncbi:MAG: tRNA pseudouridine(55) synthase TruB [Oscillospiraceae bacterium]|jgi:tRNA pseudouridine55 synthase|nr:tRNA pseudouridine(55) synthase TruB [Oscillospiraceae bacterium]
MNGLFLLDKPEGITSFSAVARLRRLLGEKKAGHTGTLDPMATGVLPVLLGGATRFSDFLPSHEKAYEARLRLGITTDTLDITGRVLSRSEVSVSRAQVADALAPFRGKIEQVPPMVSAISQGGVRLYELARKGITVERPARAVEIFSLALLDLPEPDCYGIAVRCSAGTYIRSLIDDIGRRLGCGAVMTALRRCAAHGYPAARCVTLEALEQGIAAAQYLLPIDQALEAYHAVAVSAAQALRFCSGGALDMNRLPALPPCEEGALLRVYDPEKKFLGLGRIKAGQVWVARLLVG